MAKRNSAKASLLASTVPAPAATATPAPASAPAAPVIIDVKATAPAPLTADLALAVATQYVALVVATEAMSATFVAQTRLIAAALGTRLTYAQFHAQMLPTLTEAFKGSDLSKDRVSEFCTRFRVIACAYLTGDATLAPLAGEPRDKYATRIRPLLDAYVFPDGVRMLAVNPVTGKASKRGRKPGAKASNAKPTVAPVAPVATVAPLSAAKAGESGLDVRRDLAAACIVTGEDATKAHPVAKLLLGVMATQAGRDAFCAWAETAMAETRKANVAKATANANAAIAARVKAQKANGAAVN